MTDRFKPEEALQHRIGIEKQITAISTYFINLPPEETDHGINWALKTIGEFAGDDRSYLYLFTDQGTKIENTHEWCAEGIASIIDNVKGLSVDVFPWWMDQLRRFESIHIPCVADLPPEAAAEKSILEQDGVRSVLSVPVTYGGVLVGFIGFDSIRAEKRWAEADIRLLKMVGEIISAALERKRLEETRRATLAYISAMQQISEIIEQTNDVEEMITRVIERIRQIFKADRAWLLYPCDPDAPTWRVPVESTVPEYPGAFAKNVEIPFDPVAQEICRASLEQAVPVTYGPDRPIPGNPAWQKDFSIQSHISTALRPKLGKPWMLGLHQCSHPRVWCPNEKRLFKDLSRKIADALDNLILYRNLRRSEEQYRSVVENVKEVIFQADIHGCFQFLNPAWETMTGFSVDASLGAPFWKYVHPPDKRKNEEHLHSLTTGKKESARYETRYRTKEGGVRWIEAYLQTARDPKGALTGLFGTLNDITERKQLEEQLRHAHKLEAVGQLTGGVAHEFNNLLTAITGSLDLVLDQLPPGGELHGLVNTAEQAAWRAASLTKQLLSFSRRSPIDRRPQDLGTEVKEVARLLRQAIDRRIRMEIDVADDLWPVLADAGEMNQLMMNLCVNARDALLERIEKNADASAPPDWEPRILIRVENMIVDDAHCQAHPNAKSGDHVRLSISDNGIGIDEEIRHRIFEPFFTTKKVGRGTGLGLSAVYGIVAAHQGWIELESARDEGTRFSVYFPRTKQAPISSIAPSSEKPATGGGKTILFVDDEEAIRDLGKAILEQKGYQVLTAGDGREVIEIFSKEKETIDLVILDVMMPHRSGGEVLRQLRQIDPKLKVIMSSGHRTDHSFDFTNVLFLPKPYRPDDLLRRVMEALQQPSE
ncbi:GAF domain-containing hybrid sensor histidine kinase/response regulator [Candidatus Manganitrophus noduliformans]|uniref:histidine kinase n=1 Tax=Candidatus Manganitrophus noduliformans TaxID=2606439 RepID=A0A7X6DQZ8_9BACT|nr:PAS domain S-box protein [Candidatus Manganitrophus noduliformans]NKE71776.1 PAS domain S-box protein [Candidatus Manganitrophus noduliformans]